MRRSSYILLSLLLLAACNKNTGDGSVVLKTDTIHPLIPSKDLVDPIHGTEISFSYGALSGLEGNNANGVGYRYGFSDGSTVITLNLNVPIVKGSYYIGWLTQNDSSKDWIKMGDFFAPFNDARHGLKFESKKDLTNYKNVMITLEQSQNPATPGKIVAGGALTIVRNLVPLKKPTSASSLSSSKFTL